MHQFFFTFTKSKNQKSLKSVPIEKYLLHMLHPHNILRNAAGNLAYVYHYVYKINKL